MIQVVLYENTTSKSQSFSSFPITIGKENEENNHFSLPLPSLEKDHLLITLEEDKLFLINQTDDPFVTLNQQCFYKSSFEPNDLLKVHDFVIRLEYQKKETVSQKKFPDQDDFRSFFSEEEWKIFAEKEIEKKTSDFLSKNISSFFEEESLKKQEHDSYISSDITEQEDPLDFEEESSPSWEDEAERETKEASSWRFSLRWKKILGISSFCLIFFIATAILFFSLLNSQNELEEMIAAQGVADLSMALTYAQVQKLKPQNRNWANAEFLKANLLAVLASKYKTDVNLESNGNFLTGSYPIRIYTNKDLSHFVIIAQPPPRFFSSIITPSALALDSNSMKLYQIKNLRALNRLLANNDPLEGINGQEISDLIKQGNMISLSQIAKESKNPEFTPPRGLLWISPDADNLVYNAPRYYKFCQSFLQKMVEFSVYKDETFDSLKNECESFLKLPSFVFYSSQGKGAALLAKRGLQTIAPEKEWYVGYLLFQQNGEIGSVHLLRETKTAKQENKTAFEEKDLGEESLVLDFENETEDKIEETDSDIDTTHPLYLELKKLASERQHLLSLLSKEMYDLLEKEQKKPQTHFKEMYHDLVCCFEETKKEQEKKIIRNITKLQQEHSATPFSIFFHFVKAAELESFLPLSLQNKEKTEKEDPEDTLSEWLYRIQQSTDWEELNFNVKDTFSCLTLESFPYPEKLAYFQNRVRNQVISRIDDFLFSPHYHLPKEQFTEVTKEYLQSVLHHAWILDQEEKDFFLTAFHRIKKESQASHPSH